MALGRYESSDHDGHDDDVIIMSTIANRRKFAQPDVPW